MRSLGATHLVLLLLFVGLLLDSRRFHALARVTGRARRDSGAGIPAGDPDRVGLTLRQIQMRTYVDWEDGGLAWDGPEVLPADEPVEATPEEPPSHALPVLWRPFLALGTGERPQEAAA